MTTTGERLVILSELLTVETAMVHYLAIDTSGGGGPGGTVLVDFGYLDFEHDELDLISDDGELTIEGDDDLESENGDDLIIEGDDNLEVGCE